MTVGDPLLCQSQNRDQREELESTALASINYRQWPKNARRWGWKGVI